MQMIHAQTLDKPVHIAIVISRFNEDITGALFEGAVARLKELGIDEQHITAAFVPGAVEIPVTAQRFAKLEHIAAVICLGAVIKGESSHYEYVCEQVNNGCQRLSLDSEKPIIYGVLTTLNKAQAIDRIGGNHGHFGRFSADAAYEMVSVLQQIG